MSIVSLVNYKADELIDFLDNNDGWEIEHISNGSFGVTFKLTLPSGLYARNGAPNDTFLLKIGIYKYGGNLGEEFISLENFKIHYNTLENLMNEVDIQRQVYETTKDTGALCPQILYHHNFTYAGGFIQYPKFLNRIKGILNRDSNAYSFLVKLSSEYKNDVLRLGLDIIIMEYAENYNILHKELYIQNQTIKDVLIGNSICILFELFIRAKIFHGDFNQSNIMINMTETYAGNYGRPLLIDFGLARKLTQDEEEVIPRIYGNITNGNITSSIDYLCSLQRNDGGAILGAPIYQWFCGATENQKKNALEAFNFQMGINPVQRIEPQVAIISPKMHRRLEHYGFVKKDPHDDVPFDRVFNHCLENVHKIISGIDKHIWFDNFFDSISREEFLRVRGLRLINEKDNHTMIELFEDMHLNRPQFIYKINSRHRVPLTPNNDTKKSNSLNIDAIRSPNHQRPQIIDELLNVIMIRLGKEILGGKINTKDREVVMPSLLRFLQENSVDIDSVDIYFKGFIVDNFVKMYNSAQPKRDNLKPQNPSKKTSDASNTQHTKNSNTREHDDLLNGQHANVLGNTSLDINAHFHNNKLTIQDDGQLYERTFTDKEREFNGLGHAEFLRYATNIYNFLLSVVNYCKVHNHKFRIKFEINETTSVEKLVKPRNIHIFQVVRQFVEINKEYHNLDRRNSEGTYIMTFKYPAPFSDRGIFNTNNWGTVSAEDVLIEENTTFTGRNRTKLINGTRPENRWRLKGVKGILRAYGGTRVARTRGRKIKAHKFTRIRKNKSRKNII